MGLYVLHGEQRSDRSYSDIRRSHDTPRSFRIFFVGWVNWADQGSFLGRPQGMTLCLHDRLCVCLCVNILVYTFLHFGIHFFIGLYLFNTATDHVNFWHACTLGPGLSSPNVFGDAALINYANLCKICQSVNILVHFYILVYTFFISLYLFNTATDQVYFWHACTLGPGLYSPNVFGDAALINYANLCKFSQNHIKCSYFLISSQILFKIGIQIYYRYKKKS